MASLHGTRAYLPLSNGSSSQPSQLPPRMASLHGTRAYLPLSNGSSSEPSQITLEWSHSMDVAPTLLTARRAATSTGARVHLPSV
eukprot:1186461-Prorocentrum_minimum.AAC.1